MEYEEIPILGLYGVKFVIVKINDKYVLYRGDRQNSENFVGIFSNIDRLNKCIIRRSKKEVSKNDKRC